jgi:glycosyltransferase involved in cell wall biosynthesis
VRIAFLADASLPHTIRWVNWFAQEGYNCLLLSLEEGDGYRCTSIRLPSHASLPRFLRYSMAISAARQHIEDFRPDILNAHFLPNYGWIAAHLAFHPMVLTVLGSDILTVPKTSPLHRWRTRWVLQRCDAVTADAQMLAEAVVKFGFPAERIVTVPLGIELERFPSSPQRPDPSSQHPLVVLSSRRLDPIYDVGTLMHAWSHIQAKDKALELRIAGKGSEEMQLRTMLPSDAVSFLGWLSMPALDEQLKETHVYVSTSLSDSTSVSLLEAMAAGCFPIVSDIPGNREWIVDGINGLLFRPGDYQALARALERAAANQPLRQAAQQRNRTLVEERASWLQNMDEIRVLFQGLARSPAAVHAVPQNHPGRS